MDVDVCPFPTTSSRDSWSWGLSATVEGSTTYDCFDDGVEDRWMKVTARFQQRLYLPLRGEGKKVSITDMAVVSLEEAL